MKTKYVESTRAISLKYICYVNNPPKSDFEQKMFKAFERTLLERGWFKRNNHMRPVAHV